MKLEKITICHGENKIIDSISFDVQDGEVFVLMGPSGSGKTTLLKGIAGLTKLTAGTITGKSEKASIGIVFQEPRLFPHLNVIDNLAFGLRVKGYGKAERHRIVDDHLDILQLRGLEKRFPHELSGGQKQRVSLGRAIILNPNVLLLDEPFSSLDTPLRYELTEWLYRLQREKRFSILWVTHYIDEAFSVADRIGVLINGKLLQVGEPLKVYQHPCSEEVAAFFSLPNRFHRNIWVELFPSICIPEMNEMGWIPKDALILWDSDADAAGKVPSNEVMAIVDGKIDRIKHEINGQKVVVNSKYGSWDVLIDGQRICPPVNDDIRIGIPFQNIIWYS